MHSDSGGIAFIHGFLIVRVVTDSSRFMSLLLPVDLTSRSANYMVEWSQIGVPHLEQRIG
jgi:hypothetical protein